MISGFRGNQRNSMIIFSDVDGCLTSSYKTYSDINTGLPLRVSKAFSDKDTTAIKILCINKIPLVLISGDLKINAAWAHMHDVIFHHEPNDKWEFIQKRYWKYIEKPWAYIGDSLPDFNCLKNATHSFVPADCSKILIKKLSEANKPPMILYTNGGCGVLDDVVCRLYEMGELKIY